MAVDELKRRRSFGDAASASVDASVQQIPTGAGRPVPAADGSQNNPLNTDLGRNITNTMNALPGTQGLRLGGLAERAIAPASARLAAPAAQPAAWELVGEGGQLATQGARAAAPAAIALPGPGGQLARTVTDAATSTSALAAPSGPLGRVAALAPPVTAQGGSALATAAQAAPVAAGGIGAAMIAAQGTGTVADKLAQPPKFGTASPPQSTGDFRGNTGGTPRDFTAELSQVPRNLPADLPNGTVVKTVDPTTGRVTYSGRNVGQDANGMTPMTNGAGRELPSLGQPNGNFVQAVDAAGRPTSFAAPGMDGGISLNGAQAVNGGRGGFGGGSLAAAALASPYPGISAQNNNAADALAARNDGSLEARALANKTLYDQQVASAQAINQAEYERINPLTKNQIAARKIAAETAMNAASETGANARAALKESGDTERANIAADGQIQAANQTNAAKVAAAEAKVGNSGAQQAKDTQDIFSIIDQAGPLLKTATNSYIGIAGDELARTVGKTTDGAQATAQLKVLQGALISKMPKMSGPQSDKDVQLYREMAGQIGDATIPREQREAAIDSIRKLNEKYLPTVDSAAAVEALPSGSTFRTPDGKIRRKP